MQNERGKDSAGNLSHHTAAFTLDTYGHVTEKMQQESAARMNKYIETLTKSKA